MAILYVESAEHPANWVYAQNCPRMDFKHFIKIQCICTNRPLIIHRNRALTVRYIRYQFICSNDCSFVKFHFTIKNIIMHQTTSRLKNNFSIKNNFLKFKIKYNTLTQMTLIQEKRYSNERNYGEIKT